ncbi:MAG: hypothetical protein BRC26_00985 [Nanohaloarchaea archaeon QH_8_44_6]|nr:MAG: hypothetical protein BRC26_00985 [Nanohaloarchaea archaeon QH_8_44_6]
MNSIFAEINDAIDYLKDQNDLKVFIVAKSFSAGMVLAGNIDNVDKTVLWAPAVGFQEKANIEELRDSKLGEVEEVTDIQINSEFLEHKVPVKVIHGENDQVVQIENSESIVHNLPEAEIKRISETGHSYEGKKNLVIEETIEFLNQ